MGWLKKAFKKVNNIARKIDPVGHKVVDKVVAQDSRNVRSLAKLFGGSATGKGLASSLYREADRNVQDPQWALAKAAIATATAYAGAAAYGAYAGGAGSAAGGLGGGITGTGGASGMAAYGGALPSYLGTAGSGSLGAGMAAGPSTLGGVGGALGAGYYGGGNLASDGIMASNAARIGPSTLGDTNLQRPNLQSGQQQGASMGLGGGTLGSSSSGVNLDAAGGLGGKLGYAPAQEQAWLDQYNQTMNPVQQKLAIKKDIKDNPDEWGDLAQA